MKKIIAITTLGLALSAKAAMAVPSLQLFIDPATNPGAFYDNVEQTWVSPTAQFQLTAAALDAHLGSEQGNAFEGNDTTAFLSIAVNGDSLPAGMEGDMLGESDLGAVKVNGVSYSMWVYGIPPVGGPEDIPSHGIFPTWYTQLSFTFEPFGATVNDYEPGNGGGSKTGFKELFDIDLSMLDPEVVAHFDLYTIRNDGRVFNTAPFSHDAEGNNTPVPEPGTAFLLGAGLLGLAAAKRRKA